MVKKSTRKNKPAASHDTPGFITKTSTMLLEKIEINETIKEFFPPLPDDDFQELLAKIQREGFTEAIYVWAGRGILLDGHHRLQIWREHFKDSGIAPRIIEVELADETAVYEWMLLQQRAGRKLNTAQYVEAALKLKPKFAEQARKQQRGGVRLKKDEGQVPMDVLSAVAEVAGASRDIVAKVDHVLRNGSSEIIDSMRTGELSINAAHKAVKAAKKPDPAGVELQNEEEAGFETGNDGKEDQDVEEGLEDADPVVNQQTGGADEATPPDPSHGNVPQGSGGAHRINLPTITSYRTVQIRDIHDRINNLVLDVEDTPLEGSDQLSDQSKWLQMAGTKLLGLMSKFAMAESAYAHSGTAGFGNDAA